MSHSHTNTVMVTEIVDLDDDTGRVQVRVSWGGKLRTWVVKPGSRVAEVLRDAAAAFAYGAEEP